MVLQCSACSLARQKEMVCTACDDWFICSTDAQMSARRTPESSCVSPAPSSVIVTQCGSSSEPAVAIPCMVDASQLRSARSTVASTSVTSAPRPSAWSVLAALPLREASSSSRMSLMHMGSGIGTLEFGAIIWRRFVGCPLLSTADQSHFHASRHQRMTFQEMPDASRSVDAVAAEKTLDMWSEICSSRSW